MRMNLNRERRWTLDELVAGCACEVDDEFSSQELQVEDMPESGRLIAWRTAPALTLEDEVTGDGRLIDGGALRWDSLPLPLRWVREDNGEHLGAVLVGRIDLIERRDDGIIYAEGVLFPGVEEGARLIDLLEDEMPRMGVSVDLDDIDFEIRVDREAFEEGIPGAADEGLQDGETDSEGREIVIGVQSDEEIFAITQGRIRGATVGDIPAFASAQIELDSARTEEAAADTDTDADTDTGEESEATSESETASVGVVASMIALLPEGDGSDLDVEFTEDLPHVTLTFLGDGDEFPDGSEDVLDSLAERLPIDVRIGGVGTLGDEDPPATVLLLNGDGLADLRTLAQIDGAPEQHEPFMAHMTVGYGVPLDDVAHLRGTTFTLDRVALVGAESEVVRVLPEATARTLAASALRIPTRPPRTWFVNPQLTKSTRLQVTDDGRVYGHIALWNSCHTGYVDRCVRPPRSSLNYSYFLTGLTRTEDGDVPTGPITVGTTHAGRGLTASETVYHYEHTGAAAADVNVGEDVHGIWVAGALRPTASDKQVRELLASPPSGDWRNVRGHLELMAVLAVNVPGFPVIASAHVHDGRVTSLIAGGWTVELTDDDLEDSNGNGDPVGDDDRVIVKQMVAAERARRRKRATAAALRVMDARVAVARR